MDKIWSGHLQSGPAVFFLIFKKVVEIFAESVLGVAFLENYVYDYILNMLGRLKKI